MPVKADNRPAIKLMLNGEAHTTPARTISELLSEAGYGDERVATALNGEFVAETRRGRTPLREGDRVEIVSPRQGG
jgi:sulfur carrier protein